MDRKTLEAASEQNIINPSQIDPLLSFLNKEKATQATSSHLRFKRVSGDVFITLGVIFISVAAAQFNLQSYFNLLPMLLMLIASEWLVAKRRLVLPGIAIVISLLYFASRLVDFSFTNNLLVDTAVLTSLASLFYLRYRFPFAMLAIGIGLIILFNSLISVELGQLQSLFAVYGLFIFMIAMWFDSLDTKRESYLSDTAFWLHLLAAPLFVHAVMSSLLMTANPIASKEILIIVFFISFFLLALFVDRRALLVSSFSYAVYAITKIGNNALYQIENKTFLLFITLGILIIFFGAYWHKVRTIVFSFSQNMALSNFVPPFSDRE